MLRTTTALFAAIALLVIPGCGSGDDDATAPHTPSAAATAETDAPASGDTSFLEPLGLAGSDARAIVDALDRTSDDRDAGIAGSVRPDHILFSTADGGEFTVPIEDDFYVSIAPFVEGTHECFFHNLATCQGELVGEDLDVRITTADGEVLVDETVTTFDNGFVGFWLPRDVEGTIEVTWGEKSVTAPLATGPDDPTCVTTLQLT